MQSAIEEKNIATPFGRNIVLALGIASLKKSTTKARKNKNAEGKKRFLAFEISCFRD